MKRVKPSRTDELRREYKRSDFPNGFVRGKYAARLRAGSFVRSGAETAAQSRRTSKR